MSKKVIALLVVGVVCLYLSHKKAYWDGWHRGGKVQLEYFRDSMQIEVNKRSL